MCGIASFYSTKSRSPKAVISHMLDKLNHRGPDGFGEYFAEDTNSDFCFVALGHRRLQFVGDSVEGRQPLTSFNRKCVVAINGEIYNYRSLWETYLPNIAFNDRWSDCKIVAELYDKMGVESLSLLEGIYAGIIYDASKNILIIFRDHFGTKPLYYTLFNGIVYVCSEIRPILEVTGLKPSLCKQALFDYFYYQTPLNERTFFSNIKCVAPGTSITFSYNKMIQKVIPAPWRYDLVDYRKLSLDFIVQEFKDRFFEVIERQWDPNAGAFLSGGMDSNSIVATMSQLGHKLPTFTARFHINTKLEFDKGANEYFVASEAASEYNVSNTLVDINCNHICNELRTMISRMEDLRGPMTLGAWRVAQEASKSCKILYSGLGADEIFGGYIDRLKFFDDSPLGYFETFEKLWSTKMVKREESHMAFRSEYAKDFKDYNIKDALSGAYLPLLEEDSLDISTKCTSMRFDQTFFLPALLHEEDRMCMAHGIESRIPFLDPILIRLIPNIPPDFFNQTVLGKDIMRKAMRGVASNSVLERKKQPFRVPEASWYATELNSWLQKELLHNDSFVLEIFNKSWISDIITQQQIGKINRRYVIWGLLSLNEWAKIFIL